MTHNKIINVITQRIKHLKIDLDKLPKGVEEIIINALIEELQRLLYAIENPDSEIYTSTGFRHRE